MTECFIYDAVRTPRGRGKRGGGLQSVSPVDLAAVPLRALAARNGLPPGAVDEVVLGCVEAVGEQGGDIARIAALHAGYGDDVPGIQVNRFCSSGLDAVNLAAAQVKAGVTDAMVAGGVESMSRLPMGASGGAWATDPQIAAETAFIPQGVAADLVATKYGYSRTDCDTVAVESQARAATAWEEGRFDRSVVPVIDRNGRLVLDRDEHPRAGTSLESLANLKPSFSQMGRDYGFDAVALQKHPEIEAIEHVHHAGNSSGIVDGAAALLLGTAALGEEHGLTPRARIRTWASVGTEPCIMLTGPGSAARRALTRAGMTPEDVDLWEINEAFAAVVLRFRDELGLTEENVNIDGGAIALGHPLGATGAMILGTVLDALERTGGSVGVAALCVGAGMGTATVIERL